MSRAKKLTVAGGIAVLVAAAALLALPSFFDAEAQRGVLGGRLENALQRKVKLGHIKLSLLPPALLVEDAEVAEALGFGNPTFSTAKQLRARVNLLPLLRGKLEIPSVVVEEPTIRLVKNKGGEWNFSSLGQKAAAGGAGSKAAPVAAVEIQEMRIRKGTLVVVDLGGKAPPGTYEQIDVDLHGVSAAQPFEFRVSAHIPGAGKGLVSAEGHGGPLDPRNLVASPGSGQARFEEVDLGSLATFTGQSGLGGLFSGDAAFSSDGRSASVTGTFHVERPKLSAKGSPAPAPLSGKYTLQYASDSERLELREVQLTSGKSVGRLGGHLDFARLAGSELTGTTANAHLPDVARLAPAFGLKLPAGSSLVSGTLNLNALLRGPFEHNNGRVAVEIRNARLAGYSLGAQLAALGKLAGLPTGPDTEIEKLRANLNFSNGLMSTNNLELVAPGMTVTGAGTATEAGQLNFHMTATLTRGGAVSGLLQKVTGGGNTIPFLVSGTFEHVVITPDVGRLAQGQVEQRTGGLGKVLGGLFNRKK